MANRKRYVAKLIKQEKLRKKRLKKKLRRKKILKGRKRELLNKAGAQVERQPMPTD